MGNCSALQFSSKFEVHTKGIVLRQALSHLCVSQGVSLVLDVQACSLFPLSQPWWASPHPHRHPPPTLAAQGTCRDFKSRQANPGRLFPSLQTPPPWDRPLLRAPSWQKVRPTCPSPAAFQCESQNCRTTRRGKTERCSSHSRYLLSTYCFSIPG